MPWADCAAQVPAGLSAWAAAAAFTLAGHWPVILIISDVLMRRLEPQLLFVHPCAYGWGLGAQRRWSYTVCFCSNLLTVIF